MVIKLCTKCVVRRNDYFNAITNVCKYIVHTHTHAHTPLNKQQMRGRTVSSATAGAPAIPQKHCKLLLWSVAVASSFFLLILSLSSFHTLVLRCFAICLLQQIYHHCYLFLFRPEYLALITIFNRYYQPSSPKARNKLSNFHWTTSIRRTYAIYTPSFIVRPSFDFLHMHNHTPRIFKSVLCSPSYSEICTEWRHKIFP